MFLSSRAFLKSAIICVVSSLAFLNTSLAYDGKPQALAPDQKPRELEGVGISEKLGVQMDLSTPVIDETGATVPLSSIIDGKMPVIFSLVYYSCPSLCNLHLNGLVDGLKQLDWNIGSHFKVVALSFDEKETSDTAHMKREAYFKSYGRSVEGNSWRFLTASAGSIAKITEQVGFKFRWNEESNEWAHASAAIMLTPDGKISRYLHGVMFEKSSLKLALSEASNGKIGNLVDQVVSFCFRYDPHTNKYALAAFRLVQVGGVMIILFLAMLLIPFWLKNRKAKLGAG